MYIIEGVTAAGSTITQVVLDWDATSDKLKELYDTHPEVDWKYREARDGEIPYIVWPHEARK